MYAPATFEEIRTLLLGVLRSGINGADISPGSENYQRASLAAGAGALVCEGVAYVERQVFPDTADFDNLKRHGALYGLTLNDATAATEGQVELAGTNGTVVAAGLELAHADGTLFVTTSGGTIASGVLVVDASATTTGSVGNKPTDDELTVQSPPLGVNATATIVTDFSGGTDIESQAEFLARVLERMQAGNAGGTDTDYEQWALSVDGVVSADCLATRRGAGTVSVAVYTEDVDGHREPAGSTLRTSVLDYLETVRPVTAEVDVPSVTEVALNVTFTILEYEDGYDEAEVRAAAEAAVEAYIWALRTGATAYRTALGRVIGATPGVMDYILTTPVANATCTVDSSTVEVLVPGTVTAS